MDQLIMNIVLTIVGVLFTALLSYVSTKIISWINLKVKDEKAKGFLSQITLIVLSAVQSVYQSFVETLKTEGKFNTKAQKEAKEKAMNIINNQMTSELTDYIKANFGDVQAWISEKVESTIYSLKK